MLKSIGSLFRPLSTSIETLSPKSKIKSQTSDNLFARIIEPLRKKLGEMVGSSLTKVHLKKEELVEINHHKTQLKNESHIENLKIPITNAKGEKDPSKNLDGLIFHPKAHPKESPKDAKYIVVFNGMGDLYEKHLESLDKLAQDTGFHLVGFNYRGVGESQGKANSGKDLIQDGQSVVESLLNKGISADNILFYGHSMGAAVAAGVYDDMDHKGPIISESSFSSFSKAISSKKGKISEIAVKALQWDFKNNKIIKKIDSDKRAVVVNRRDPTVRYQEASLYQKLKGRLKPGDYIQRIKIGERHEKMETVAVKTGNKKIKLAKGGLVKQKPEPSEYDKNLAKAKQQGLIRFLRHPHERIMDHADKSPTVKHTGVTPEQQDLINKLNKKYQKEDDLAYKALVQLMQNMLAPAKESKVSKEEAPKAEGPKESKADLKTPISIVSDKTKGKPQPIVARGRGRIIPASSKVKINQGITTTAKTKEVVDKAKQDNANLPKPATVTWGRVTGWGKH